MDKILQLGSKILVERFDMIENIFAFALVVVIFSLSDAERIGIRGLDFLRPHGDLRHHRLQGLNVHRRPVPNHHSSMRVASTPAYVSVTLYDDEVCSFGNMTITYSIGQCLPLQTNLGISSTSILFTDDNSMEEVYYSDSDCVTEMSAFSWTIFAFGSTAQGACDNGYSYETYSSFSSSIPNENGVLVRYMFICE